MQRTNKGQSQSFRRKFTNQFESLEPRKLLSSDATALGGGLYDNALDLGVVAERRSPNFPVAMAPLLTKAAKFQVTQNAAVRIETALGQNLRNRSIELSIFDGKRTVYTRTLQGDRATGMSVVTPTLNTGEYTLVLKNRSKIEDKVVSKVSLSKFKAPSRVEAVAWGGKTIRLNWLDNTSNEKQFVVDRRQDGKWVRSAVVDSNATAAVVDGLDVNRRYTFRVTAVGAGVQSTGLNMVAASTGPADTTGWYKVSNLGGVTRGSADWRITAGGLNFQTDVDGTYQNRWIFSSSWQLAVWTAIQGSVTVTRTTGGALTHNFPSGGDFKVDTRANLIAQGGTAQQTKFKLTGGSPEDKLVVLEDSYGEVDKDYDDFWWGVSVSNVAFSVKRIVSDQFLGATENYITPDAATTSTGNVNEYMLVGVNTTDQAALRVEMEINGDIQGFKESVIFALQPSSDPNIDLPRTLVTWNGSIATIKVGVPLTYNLSQENLNVRIGFANRSREGRFSSEDTAAVSPLNIRVVNRMRYDGAIDTLRLGANWFGGNTPFATEFLNAFLDDRVINGARSIADTLTNDSRLSHRVGAAFGTPDNIRRQIFDQSTSPTLPKSVAESSVIRRIIEAQIRLYVENNASSLMDAVSGFDPDDGSAIRYARVGPIPVLMVSQSVNFNGGDDLNYAIGRAELGPVSVFLNLKRTATGFDGLTGFINWVYTVLDYEASFSVTDLYDFQLTGGGQLAHLAATVQAGYGTLGTSGHIFKVEINCNNRQVPIQEILIGERRTDQ